MSKRATKRANWQSLNTKEFCNFVNKMQSMGIESLTYQDISISFGEKKQQPIQGLAQVELSPELTEEQKKKEEEETLFWSSGG